MMFNILTGEHTKNDAKTELELLESWANQRLGKAVEQTKRTREYNGGYGEGWNDAILDFKNEIKRRIKQ